MRNKVLIVGKVLFCKAVLRAIVNVETLNRPLIRFLYSRNIKDNLLTCDIDLVDNTLSQQYDIKLIIACLDLPAFALIRDIRIGKYGEYIARVPIVIISVHSFTHTNSPLILYHIYQSGAYLEIPFELDDLRTTLESLKSLTHEQLSRIRSDKPIFCDVIDSVAHSLTDDNYRSSLQHIVALAEVNFQGEYLAIKKLRGLLDGSEKIDGEICPHIKKLLNEVRVEVITDGR